MRSVEIRRVFTRGPARGHGCNDMDAREFAVARTKRSSRLPEEGDFPISCLADGLEVKLLVFLVSSRVWTITCGFAIASMTSRLDAELETQLSPIHHEVFATT